MPRYLGALTIVLFVGMVVARLLLLKRQGIAALKFGDTHKTDFLIPPFALFYFYLVFAAAFGLPTLSTKEIFHSGINEWLGVAFCFAGLSFLLWSLISFGKSFRVGIPRQTCDGRNFCIQPQSYLCVGRPYPDRPIPDFV